ncbi:hypothetical protein BO99DRAFT_404039 [Aspergillus violaceofuscus CBS 115571]|uniref:Uncharacterized protein n=1 Tax=Aspergillus violaceofuscus (strain CBS 115571) TaxID=1450538 RepID=A0A2V5H1L3_ASPV1|nr:hypothetical protein BO99DRAFT_404039 [Aspergillus violaceofuscus CBS 115571]
MIFIVSFIHNYLFGLLAVSLAASAMPAENIIRASDTSINLEAREACFGGSYETCLTEYFELFCVAQCASDNLEAGEDCRQACDTGASSYCEEKC